MKRYLVFGLILLVPLFTLAEGFDRDLQFGMQNNSDVIKLQELLTDEGLYSGPISGNFFSLTLKAVKKFQAREGIKTSGYFGLKTRTRANTILVASVSKSENQTSAENITPPVSVSTTSAKTENTKPNVMGSIIDQIAAMQKQLDLLLKKTPTPPVQTVVIPTQTTTVPIVSNTTPLPSTPTQTITPPAIQPTPQSNIQPPTTQSATTPPPIQPSVTSSVASPPPTQTPAPTQTDTSSPIISDVQVKNITINSATISWKTNESSDTKLEYGKDSSLGQSQIINQVNFATTHSVELSNLQVGTNYYFRITARDQSGNEVKSEIKKFTTIAIGSLSFSLVTDNPPAKSVIRTNYGTAAENEIEFLKIKLTASAEEDIAVQSISTTLTNSFGMDHSGLYIDGVKNGTFCCGSVSLSPFIVPAGGQKILSFRVTPLQDGQTLNTALQFITSGIVAVGKLSSQQVTLSNTETVIGNNITLVGVPYFNYSPSALLREITPGRGRVLEVETGGFMETNLSLHKLTFQIDSTNIANSKWNTCGTGKLETIDFSLSDYIIPSGYSGVWQLLNTGGGNCLTGEKVAYARFIFGTPLSIPQRQNRILILSVDTTGATVGDQVRFHLLNDDSSTLTNLEWSRADDGVRRSGYRLRNLPIHSVPITYSSLCEAVYCPK